jgi:hypothetical protein
MKVSCRCQGARGCQSANRREGLSERDRREGLSERDRREGGCQRAIGARGRTEEGKVKTFLGKKNQTLHISLPPVGRA